MKRITKQMIYAEYGIKYDSKTQKIFHPVYGWIRTLLVNGNKKIGVGAYHFSTLPGTALYHVKVNGMSYDVKGTCVCDCIGCYAKTGNYNFSSVKNALGMRTLIAMYDTDFMYRAIMAQIKADKIHTIRIHAAGDFCTSEYAETWFRIVNDCKQVTFWTYTKVSIYETLFDCFDNANIVKSIIPNIGMNYGHCDYIKSAYESLLTAGKSVYICKCGIDSNQHCINCKGCSANEYVLFIEHSTEYVAEKDPEFESLKAIIEGQQEK